MFHIYSKPGCSFCVAAKELLQQKNLPFAEYVLDIGQQKEDGVNYYTVAQLHAKIPGARTVPQIFENDQLIGGFEALKLHVGKQA